MNDKHCYKITGVAIRKISVVTGIAAILRLRLMSLRVDTEAKQSYLTSRPKEVQIGHENYA